jgi:hypothetical protein
VQIIVNVAQVVQDTNDNLRVIAAATYNNRVVARNKQRQVPAPYFPLQKTVCAHPLIKLPSHLHGLS